MNKRDDYLQPLLEFLDKDLIKVVTGIRRSGKSFLLKLFIEELKRRGIGDERIIEVNFESMKFAHLADYKVFYNYVAERIQNGVKTYIFLDEPQNVESWEKAVNSFRVDFDVDIYITGSNARLLSSELSTLISGRYVEIDMYPLSYKEYLDFHGIEKGDDSFQKYLKFGGFPSTIELGFNVDRINNILEGIYNTVLVKDVIKKNQITDEGLLEKIVLFLADNIGNSTSSNSIANALVSDKRVADNKKTPASATVDNYIFALKKAHVVYEAKRYDIKGKEHLKTLGKYYIVDIGLRNMLLGYRDVDRGHILENVVFLELLRRGYNVSIGKVGEKEIDFIAEKADDKIYVQVCEALGDEKTLARELAPLLEVRDNYEKLIITNDKTFVESYEGIKVKNTINWLCE
jgi:predicted AAA+ superfamily ATPase